MTGAQRSRLGAACIVGATAIALSGCASWGLSQEAWSGGIRDLPGVEDVTWKYRNNWPSSGPRYDATITLAPDVTVEESRDIARATCAAETNINRLTLTTPGLTGAERPVSQWIAATQTCIEADTLERFARVAQATQRLPRDFVGSVTISGEDAEAAATAPPPDATAADAASTRVSVVAESWDMVWDAAREIQAATPDGRLSFSGTSQARGTGSGDDTELFAELSPEADLDSLDALVTHAATLDLGRLTITDRTADAAVRSSADTHTPAAAEFRALAQRAGVAGTTTFTIPGVEDSDGLVARLEAIGGGAALSSTGSSSDTSIAVAGPSGIEEAVRVLASSEPDGPLMRVAAAGPETFWVAMRAGDSEPELIARAARDGLDVSSRLPSLDRTIVSTTPEGIDLTVYLDTAEPELVQSTRAALLTVLEDGAFVTAHVQGPEIPFSEGLVTR